jgi:hypothetical protein
MRGCFAMAALITRIFSERPTKRYSVVDMTLADASGHQLAEERETTATRTAACLSQ